jgi:hypothetical protein
VELNRRNFHLGALVLNRTLPRYLLSADGDRAANTLCADAGPLAAEIAETGVPELTDPARVGRVLTTIGESFRNFAVVAKREAELRVELARAPEVVVDVPAFESDIGDVSGLARIADHLLPSTGAGRYG